MPIKSECDEADIQPHGVTSVEPNRSSREPAIQACGLTKDYKLYPSVMHQTFDMLGAYRWFRPGHSFPTFRALEGIDLEIGSGERIGIIGRNGAGKTTLLRLITGITEPTGGSVDVNGNVQALMQVGVGFHPEFTGRENIRASLLYTGLESAEQAEAVADIIGFCELGEFLDQPVKTYSLGMQARLQFACATALKPEILIVDEILGAGDAYFSAKSSTRMERLTQSGCTLLLVSHSMAQVIQFCERCVWLDDGKIRMHGPVRDVVLAYEQFMFEQTKSLDTADSKTELSVESPYAETNNKESQPDIEGAKPTDVGERQMPDWLQERILSDMGSNVANNTDTLNESDNTDGMSRWRADGRLSIVGLRFHDGGGEARRTFRTGSSLGVDVTIEAHEQGVYPVWFLVMFYSEEDKALFRLVSPKRIYKLQIAERQRVRVKLEELQLGAGRYYASVGIFKRWSPDDRTSANWYEVLNRNSEILVQDDGPFDPSLFRHAAHWTLDERNE